MAQSGPLRRQSAVNGRPPGAALWPNPSTERRTDVLPFHGERLLVYVDESGDHSLTSINPDHPMFVLTFSIFPIDLYVDRIVPMVQRHKFDFFNTDMVALHEREIWQAKPPVRHPPQRRGKGGLMRRTDGFFDARARDKRLSMSSPLSAMVNDD